MNAQNRRLIWKTRLKLTQKCLLSKLTHPDPHTHTFTSDCSYITSSSSPNLGKFKVIHLTMNDVTYAERKFKLEFYPCDIDHTIVSDTICDRDKDERHRSENAVLQNVNIEKSLHQMFATLEIQFLFLAKWKRAMCVEYLYSWQHSATHLTCSIPFLFFSRTEFSFISNCFCVKSFVYLQSPPDIVVDVGLNPEENMFATASHQERIHCVQDARRTCVGGSFVYVVCVCTV